MMFRVPRHGRRSTKEAGYLLVLFALSLVVLLGFIGLVVDVGYFEFTKRRMQTAADSAALAGAQELLRGNTSDVSSSAAHDATVNGYNDGSNGVTVTVNQPPASGANAGNSKAVEVIISQTQPTFFMRALNINTASMTARGVGILGNSPACVYALNSSRPNAIEVSGRGNVVVNCGVFVNSSSLNAMSCNGTNATLDATQISAVGGASGTCFNPTPSTGALPVTDPFATLQAPAVGSCTGNPDPTLVTGTATLSPGLYCNGININASSGSVVTFNSGTYVINGSGNKNVGFTISGQGTIQGTGVTFYNTATSSSNFQPANITGGANMSLSAPNTGSLEGILFFQDRSVGVGSQNQFAGTSATSLQGSLYLPTGNVKYGGTTSGGAAYTIIVADTIVFNGTGTFNSNYSGLSGGSPVKVVLLGE